MVYLRHILYMLIGSVIISFIMWRGLRWPEHRITFSSIIYEQQDVSQDSCSSYHLKVDPFDAYVLPFMRPQKLVCPQEAVLTFVDQEKGLLLLRPGLAENVICYFSWIHVKDQKNIVFSEKTVIPTKGVHFSKENYVAKVRCYNTSVMDPDYDLDPDPIYRNTHLWVPDFPKTNATGPSVFILVLESLSRLSYMRFMPKTRAALDSLGHVQVMRGLNVVAANSFPNSMALLAGNTGEGMGQPDSYDHWLPYVWQQFKAKGYVTGFTEDMNAVGLFKFNRKGFVELQTDYVAEPFWLHMFEFDTLYKYMKQEKLYCFHKNGTKIDAFLDQMKQFILKMQRQDQPYFMYSFAAQMTHEDFNNFQLVDDPVAKFVDWFKGNPHQVNNTVLIVMGDHGPRYGGIVGSPLGQLESRLPLFSIRVPEKLVEKYPHLPKFLASNSDRLITWYDVHQLLVDVASDDFTPITKNRVNVTALSPWRELVPLNRTCRDANIPKIYCVCRNMFDADPDIGFNLKAAETLIETIAAVVDPLCGIRLTYNRTLNITYILPEGRNTFSSLEKVKLIVLTQPWDLPMEAVMVREAPGGEGPYSPWRMFDTKLTGGLRGHFCTASDIQSMLNIIIHPRLV